MRPSSNSLLPYKAIRNPFNIPKLQNFMREHTSLTIIKRKTANTGIIPVLSANDNPYRKKHETIGSILQKR